MFDIIAASYMSAARMEHFLEQDFMHKDPRIAQRLRHIHGMGSDMAERNRYRAKPVFRPAIRWAGRQALVALGWAGHRLRRTGEAFERASPRSFQREIYPDRLCADGGC